MGSPKARVLRRGLFLWVVLVLIGASLACGRSGDSEPSSDEGAEDAAAESDAAEDEVEEEEEAGLSFEEIAEMVCSGAGVPEAAAYDASQSGPHPIILASDDGQIHPLNEELKEIWKPKDVASVELVACMEPTMEVWKTPCLYETVGGDTVNVWRQEQRLIVYVREAQTGAEVDFNIAIGPNPPECPETISESVEYITGDSVTITELESKIKEFVMP